MGSTAAATTTCRTPEQVAENVRLGFVMPTSAAAHYGVVVVLDGSIDRTATETKRAALRTSRLGVTPRIGAPPAEGHQARPAVAIGDDIHFRCCCCADLGRADSDWKPQAVMQRVLPEVVGRHIRLHAELELRASACPSCGTALELEVCRKGAESLATVQLNLGVRAAG
jgi:N-methylhydantoinase B